MLTVTEHSDLLLAHDICPAGPIPTAQQPDSCYPYESYCETAKRPRLREYRFATLENRWLRVCICPDLGGKVYSIYHKPSEKNVLRTDPIVRPIRILPRQFYIGGGIEVSFPISHTPVQVESLCCRTALHADRAFVWCGETEIKFGMRFTVEYSLGRDDCFLTQRTYFENPTDSAHPWMCWSNAGVPARPDTEIHYPDGQVLEHGVKLHMIDWATQGPRKQEDIKLMTGWFWRQPTHNAFGVYTPSLGCGLYHIADPKEVPGIKLWSDGVGDHTEFVTQWTLNGAQCLEIQAGPLVDQGVKQYLQPGQQHVHTEFWYPSDQPMDIVSMKVPAVSLPPVEDIPLFEYARPGEVSYWQKVLLAFATKNAAALPAPLGVDCNCWPPTGLPGLLQALRWAVEQSENQGYWRYCFGTLLAAEEENDEAIKQLLSSEDDRGYALAARLLRRVRQDFSAAAQAFARIQSPVFARHPQVVFERDLALAGLGKQKLEERRYWLDETKAIADDWLVERRAALLIDEQNYEQARALLENTRFQLVHQRYARTALWRKVEEALGLPRCTKLNWMGEDTLAEFGKYQEYVGD